MATAKADALLETLRHQVTRDHDYSPDGCSPCDDARKALTPEPCEGHDHDGCRRGLHDCPVCHP